MNDTFAGLGWLAVAACIAGCGGSVTRTGSHLDGGSDSDAAAAGEHLYAVNSDSQDASAFEIDTSTGALTSVPGSPFAAAPGAFWAAVTPALNNLFVATLDGRVTTFSVARGPGALTLVGTSPSLDSGLTTRALAAHPAGGFLFAANCGAESAGSLSVFALDRKTGLATPSEASLPTSFCPNGLAVDPSGRFLYVSSQYANEGDVEGFSIDPKSGALAPLEGSPFASYLAVAIVIDPSGKHVYVCDQSGFVRAFGVDARSGALDSLGLAAATGANPFSVAIDRAGARLFVGNWSSGTVSSYLLDSVTGAPTEVQGSPFAARTAPILQVVDASNQFLYAIDQELEGVQALAIGSSGELTPAAGSPFPAGTSPSAVIAVP